ncbi:MAG: alpha/beta fold hydrolase, partial [Chitinophagaceae bacterium]|nr:alpha/beta fold hydrolase [Chitinophagaceae bacterium]
MKPHLLMLHGAIGASSQLQHIAGLLSPKYEIHLFDFPGHGGKGLNEENFSIELFANAVVSFLEEQKIKQVNIFGYSMGGYVALYLARHHPELINKIITLGTKFHWNKETAANEVKMLDPEKIAVKVPSFAKALETLH